MARDRVAPVVMLLSALMSLLGCASTQPTCLTTADSDVVGTWVYAGPGRYAMRRQAADLGRPEMVEFRQDGSFVATFSEGAADHRPARGAQTVPAGDVAGRWSAGRYCLESLFIPRTVIATTPRLPNTAAIRIIGDRLLISGADSGTSDAEYRRGDAGTTRNRPVALRLLAAGGARISSGRSALRYAELRRLPQRTLSGGVARHRFAGRRC